MSVLKRMAMVLAGIAMLLPASITASSPAGWTPVNCFLTNCKPYNEATGVEFGRLQVPVTQYAGSGDSLDIGFVRLKHSTGQAGVPVVFLAGGPGKPALTNLDRWLNHPLRKRHDLVIFDYRGLGYSSPVQCEKLKKGLWNMLAANLAPHQQRQRLENLYRACLNRLRQQSINPANYSIDKITSDVVSLRKALGIEKWMLYGVSYGTVIAQRVMQRDSGGVAGAILDSYIPIKYGTWKGQTKSYYATVKKLAGQCKQDSACQAEYGDILGLFQHVSEQLRRNPLRFSLDGAPFVINYQDFHLAIQQLLYSPSFYPMFPQLLQSFHNKDTLLIKHFVERMKQRFEQFNPLMQMDVLASNNFPLASDTVKSNPHSKIENALSYIDQQGAVIKNWPVENSPWNNNKLAQPVLLLHGDYDPVTPAANQTGATPFGHKVFRATLPRSGHMPSMENPCAAYIAVQFANNPQKRPNMQCMAKTDNTRFLTNIYHNPFIYNLANDVFLDFNTRPVVLALLALVMFLYNLIAMFIFWNRDKKLRPSKRLIRRTWGGQGVCGLVLIAVVLYQLTSAVTLNPAILMFGLPHQSAGFWFEILGMVYLIYSAFAMLALLRFAFIGFSIKLGVRNLLSALATIAFTVLIFTYGIV